MGKTKLPHKSLTPGLVSILKKNRIEIFVGSSDALYQDYATLVDSPVYIGKVIEARKLLRINKVPFMDVSVLTESAGHVEDRKKPVVSNMALFMNDPRQNLLYKLQDYDFWQKILNIWCKGDTNKIQQLRSTAENINNSLNEPYYLTDTTMQAILLGMAAGHDDLISWVTEDTVIPRPSVVIHITPRTTYSHVKAMMKMANRFFFKDIKNLDEFVPHIREYQDWYWSRLSGKTNSKIASEWVKNVEDEKLEEPNMKFTKKESYGENATDIDILKGVKKYISLLHF